MSKFVNIVEVAERFNRSVSWVYQNYKNLNKSKNFPLPKRLNGYNLMWLDKEVDYWFDLQLSSAYCLNDNAKAPCYEKLLAANAAFL